MGNSLSIKLEGASSLIDRLKLLVPAVREQVKDTIAETTLLIESDAKQNAPVDTGRLRSSIHSELAPNGLTGYVSTNVTYAPFVELGTRRQRAQPFLFPAYEKNRAAFVAALKRNLKLF